MQDFIRRTLAETGVEKETPPCIAFFSIFFRVSYIMNKCLGYGNRERFSLHNSKGFL